MADETELVELVADEILAMHGEGVSEAYAAAERIALILQRDRADAYEEGVEDGISWHCFPESGPRPTWTARAALSGEAS